MRSRWSLTLRGGAALALAVVSIALGEVFGLVGLIAFGVFCGILLSAGVIISFLPGGAVEATRTSSPEVAVVGERMIVTVRIARRDHGFRVLREWFDASLADAAAHLSEASASELRYLVDARRRGEILAGPILVVSTDPFGLVVRRDRVGGVAPILIAAPMEELDPIRVRVDHTDGPRPQQHAVGLDDVSARPHAPGDPMRRIHWRATARHGELMVRQEESSSAPDALVILDRGGWSPVAGIVGLDPAFERAVTATVSAAVRLGRDGFDVTIVDASGAPLALTFPVAEAIDARLIGARLATVTADGGERVPLSPALDDAPGPLVLVTPEGAGLDQLDAVPAGTGPSSAVLVRCSEGLRPAFARGWHIVDAPPSVDLSDAWRGAVSR